MTELEKAARQLIDAANTAAKHFGYSRLGGCSLDDSNVRVALHKAADALTQALATAEPQSARIWINHDLRDVSVREQDEPGWVTFDVEVGQLPATTEPVCACGDRPASQCDEEWGPQCDLGNNPRYARPATTERNGEPATIEDNSQQWAGMDGATAWHLIYRHADGWGDTDKMMGEWLKANTSPQAPEDFLTHRDAWRKALVLAESNATAQQPDIDDKAYWRHELQAFDLAYAAIDAARKGE